MNWILAENIISDEFIVVFLVFLFGMWKQRKGQQVNKQCQELSDKWWLYLVTTLIAFYDSFLIS